MIEWKPLFVIVKKFRLKRKGKPKLKLIVWVAVEVNVGAFGSNVTEVNNRPLGTKRFVL